MAVRHDCNSSECGPNEDRVKGHARRDRFCRPHVTPRDVLTRRRSCVCKRGYVRNSWDECVTVRQCTKCKCRPQKDWNLCASGCPPRCNQPIAQTCRTNCSPGCDCPPGWVLDSKDRTRCVKVQRCSPQCPAHSKYQQCTSSCAPSCVNSVAGRNCITRCYTGSCVCQEGYYEFLQNGAKTCLTKDECSRFIRPETTITGRNEIEYTGGGVRAPTVLFPPDRPGISGHTSTGISRTTGCQTTAGGTGCHLPTIYLRLRQGSAGNRLELEGIARERTTVTGTTSNRPPAVLIETLGTPSVNTGGHGSEVLVRRQEGAATIVSTTPSLPSLLRYPQDTARPGSLGLHTAGTRLESATAITATASPSSSILPLPQLPPSVGGETVTLGVPGPRHDGTYLPGRIGYGLNVAGTRPGGEAAITAMAPPSLGVSSYPLLAPPLGSEPGRLGVTVSNQRGPPTLPTAVGIVGRGLSRPLFDEDLDVGEEEPLPETLKIPPHMQPIPPTL
ncbi:uncharacterized protein LOC125939880 [Dermacentor silvarum]|uniref:uncharacterized protein LOC125939880 n=1 Tax=Dermacentor silvarum TaxID=543639 RepID=UPI0021010AB6|nr:uncharacterized protein LOC125939880 [Dermacentor silvarum]